MLFSPGWRASTRQEGVLAYFTAGLALGGLLSAFVLWLLSGLSEPIPKPARTALVAGLAAIGGLREFGLLRLPLPQNARQIPQDVLQFRPRLGPLQFGFELGTGVRTYVSATAPYVVAIALVLSHPGLAEAAVAGLAFGLGRAVTAAMGLWSRGPEWNARATSRLGSLTKTAAVAILVVLVITGV